MNCPKCQETSYYKNGKAMGRQRYKCKQCGCNFTQSKKQGYSLEKRLMALKLYLEGMGFRGTGRVLGVSNVTVRVESLQRVISPKTSNRQEAHDSN